MSTPTGKKYRFGLFLLDTTENSLVREATKEHVRLTPREYQMLCLFVRNPNQLYSREELLEKFWIHPEEIEDNNVAKHISALRKYLGDTARDSKYIATTDDGYRFVAQVIEVVDESAEPRPMQEQEEIGESPKAVEENEPIEAERPPVQVVAEETESTQVLAQRLAAKAPVDGMDTFGEWLSGPGKFKTLTLLICIILTLALSAVGVYTQWEWTNMFVSLAQAAVLILLIAFPLRGPKEFQPIVEEDEEKRAAIRIGTDYDDLKEWGDDSNIAQSSLERYTTYWRGILLTWLMLYIFLGFLALPYLDLNCQVEQSTLCIERIKDSTGLKPVASLKNGDTPLSKYLQAHFSQETQQALHQYNDSTIAPDPLRLSVIRELNRLLNDSYLQQFTGDLKDGDKQEVEQRRRAEGLAAANRALLDYSYPGNLQNASSQRWVYGLRIFSTLFNNFSSLMIILAFNILNKPTEIKKGKRNVSDTYLGVGLALVVAVTVIEILAVTLPTSLETYLVLKWWGWGSGIFGGIAMALYVGRLQSKFLGPRALLLLALYSYTAIQSLFVFLEARQAGAVALIDIALILKCLLFLYMMWLFQSGRLLFYLVRARRTYRDVKKEWRVFRTVLETES